MRYAVAVSEHHDPRVAAAEVIGQVLERIGTSPGLTVLFVSGSHASEVDQIARTVRQSLEPGHLLGATAASVLAHRQEVEEAPAIVLWAGHTGPVDLLVSDGHLDLATTPEGASVIALADPFTFNAQTTLASVPPGVHLVGGLASFARAPGGNRLVADNETTSSGSVMAILPEGLAIRPLVSQGCRPIGDPFTITDSSRTLILGLGGKPAVQRLDELLASASEADRHLVGQGLQIGLAVDEHAGVLGSGDFLIRNVVGADRSSGGIALAGLPTIGETAQFHVRDPDSASNELAEMLQPLRAESALLFTCAGRGRGFFSRPSHDAELFCDGLGTTAVGGMFCAGEMGPVGTAHHVHGFTASGLLFGASSSR
jgi:small ligand-binding sensory domain FIST